MQDVKDLDHYFNQIMVEVLKMNLLLWHLSEAARMVMTSRAGHMPPHGDIIQVIGDAHAKRIDRACNGFDQGLKGMRR